MKESTIKIIIGAVLLLILIFAGHYYYYNHNAVSDIESSKSIDATVEKSFFEENLTEGVDDISRPIEGNTEDVFKGFPDTLN